VVERRDYTVRRLPDRIDADSFERITVLIDGQRFSGRVGYSLQRRRKYFGSYFPAREGACSHWLRTRVLKRRARSGITWLPSPAEDTIYEVRLAKRWHRPEMRGILYLRSQPNFQLKPAMRMLWCAARTTGGIGTGTVCGDRKSAPPK